MDENEQKCAISWCDEDGKILLKEDGKYYCIEHADEKIKINPSEY